jgi:hypothetical protein
MLDLFEFSYEEKKMFKVLVVLIEGLERIFVAAISILLANNTFQQFKILSNFNGFSEFEIFTYTHTYKHDLS